MNSRSSEVSTATFQYIVQRADGAGLAATGHDRAASFGGVRYDPDFDLAAQKLCVDENIFDSFLQIQTGMQSSGITEADMHSGRWDNAMIRMQMSDWAIPAPAPVELASGTLSPLARSAEAFVSSVSILPKALDEPGCVKTSSECRAELGDRKCQVSMRSRGVRSIVTQVAGSVINLGLPNTAEFMFGTVRWLSGDNAGLDARIFAVAPNKVTVEGAIAKRSKIGDRILLREGCDGRRSTCRERFGNLLNFRGEPDLPGSDALMRYPGV